MANIPDRETIARGLYIADADRNPKKAGKRWDAGDVESSAFYYKVADTVLEIIVNANVTAEKPRAKGGKITPWSPPAGIVQVQLSPGTMQPHPGVIPTQALMDQINRTHYLRNTQ